MYVRSLYIEAFAALENKELQFSEGLNIIEGTNESGKSSVCMFIKFMLYGLSGRTADGEMSERQKYVPWNSGRAAGNMRIVTAKGEYLIERSLTVSQSSSGQNEARERLEVTDVATGERVFKGKVPGEAILGIDEQMFVNTVFVRQISGSRVDGEGMAEAIENILLTGDESVSVKRAVDRLEKSRKALMHKRGTGGKLSLHLQEEARLEQKIREAREGNASIILLENESARLDALIAQRTAEKESNARLLWAYEKIEAGRRVSEAHEIAAKLDGLTKELGALDKYGSITEGVGRINALSQELAVTESRLKTLRRTLGEEPDKRDRMTEDEIALARRDCENAKKARTKKTVMTALAVLFFVLGAVLGGGGVLLLRGAGMTAFVASIAACAVFVILGAVSIAVGAVSGSGASKLMKKWGAARFDELESRVEDRIVRARVYEKTETERKRKEAEIEACDAEREGIIERLRASCAVFAFDDTPDTDILVSAALEVAGEVSAKREELKSAVGMAKGELRSYSAVLGTDGGLSVKADADAALETEEGKKASLFTRRDAELTRSKKDFAESSLPGLLRQKGDADGALARLRATTHDCTVLASQLDGIRREIDSMKARLGGIEAARDALLRAGEGLRSSLMPKVVSEAGRYVSDFTDGKYDSVAVNGDFSLDFLLDGKKRDISYMSAGTGDMAYISLRSAICRVLFFDDKPFLVYDESFARIDKERLSKIIGMLGSAADMQSLVFSCRTLEGELAEKVGAASVIEL